MEVVGKRNIFSTPKSRARKRDNAHKPGIAEKLTSNYAKVAYIAAGVIATGFIEKIYIPL